MSKAATTAATISPIVPEEVPDPPWAVVVVVAGVVVDVVDVELVVVDAAVDVVGATEVVVGAIVVVAGTVVVVVVGVLVVVVVTAGTVVTCDGFTPAAAAELVGTATHSNEKTMRPVLARISGEATLQPRRGGGSPDA